MHRRLLLTVLPLSVVSSLSCKELSSEPTILDAGKARVTLPGDAEHVVGVPFSLRVMVSGPAPRTHDVEFLVDPARGPLPPEVAAQTLTFEGREGSEVHDFIDLPLVCATEGHGKSVFAAISFADRTTRDDTDEIEIHCVAAPDSDSDPTTDPTADPTAEAGGETTGGSTGGSTGWTDVLDFHALAFTYDETMHGLQLGDPPSLSPGVAVEGIARELRVERNAGGYEALAHYQLGDEAGILYGAFTDELPAPVSRVIPGATNLSANAFNGTEFIVTDPVGGIWLFDGETLTEANTPVGAFGVACDERTCIAGASSGGFLRSSDGGENWTLAEGTEIVGKLGFGAGSFVGYDGFNLELIVSDDAGQTWTPGVFPGTLGPFAIEFASDRFVAAAGVDIMYSDDGMNWKLAKPRLRSAACPTASSRKAGWQRRTMPLRRC